MTGYGDPGDTGRRSNKGAEAAGALKAVPPTRAGRGRCSCVRRDETSKPAENVSLLRGELVISEDARIPQFAHLAKLLHGVRRGAGGRSGGGGRVGSGRRGGELASRPPGMSSMDTIPRLSTAGNAPAP